MIYFSHDTTPLERTLIDHAAQTHSPINGTFELTPACNMACNNCHGRLTSKEVERQGRLRNVGEWMNIARQMRDKGTLFLLLTGGEPLFYPDFQDLYLKLRALGFLVSVATNGTLIDEDWAKFFGEHKPRRMNVVLHGPDDEYYAANCGLPGGYEKTIQGIRLLRAQGVDVHVTIYASRKNAEHMERMLAQVHELDVPLLVDTYMQPDIHERALPIEQQTRLTPEDAAELRFQVLKSELSPEKFSQYTSENLWAVTHIRPNSTSIKMHCQAGTSSCFISWMCQLRPCANMSLPSISVLNTSFEEAWKQLREEVSKITLNPRCSSCSLRTLCRICAANAMAETSRADGKPEYMCRYSARTLLLLHQQPDSTKMLLPDSAKTQ